MHENTSAVKSIPHRLFVLKSPLDANRNEYDIILTFGFRDGQPIIPNDLELCIKLYDKMYNNYDPAFNLVDCLNYHYDSSEEKESFLFCVKNGLNMQHSSYDITYNAAFRHSTVMSWFDAKEKSSRTEFNLLNIPEAIGHKILLLYELGVIEHLTKEYFDSKQKLRTNTNLAALIAVIIGEPDSIETIRKAISGIGNRGNSDPATKPAINKIGAFLYPFSIEIKRLKKINN